MKLIVVFLTAVFALGAGASTYQVPVPDALQSVNTFVPTRAVGSIENNILTVNYQLPVELVGDKAPEFTFTGKIATSDFVPVQGADVYGMCMFSKSKPMACMLKYPGLEMKIDADARDQAVRDEGKAQGWPGLVISNRIKVGELFQENPAGLLTLDVTRR